MSRKSDLKKAIAESEQEIENLEKKRVRSQSALLEAFLNHTTPNDADAEYLKVLKSLIDFERAHLRKVKEELANLEG